MKTILQRFLKVFHFKKTEKITGAFGLKFGDTFEAYLTVAKLNTTNNIPPSRELPSRAFAKRELTNNTPVYRFSPKNPFQSFTRYYVSITPKTHKIYKIWTLKSIKKSENCEKEQEFIMMILEKKYGKSEKSNAIPDTKTINQGNRNIICKYNILTVDMPNIQYIMDIRYTDRKLERLAEKERIEMCLEESEKLDISGL